MERTRDSDQCRLGQSRKVSAKSGRLESFYFCEVDLWLLKRASVHFLSLSAL